MVKLIEKLIAASSIRAEVLHAIAEIGNFIYPIGYS